MKCCSKCELVKDLDLFPKGRNVCKTCRNKVSANSYRKNKSYYKKKHAEHYRANKEYYHNKSKTWITDNKERHDEWRRSYQQLDYQLNSHKYRSRVMKRYSAKLSATPKWLTKEQTEQIELIYWQARDCSIVSGQDYDVDHIVPLQGENICGLHVPWNLCVLPSDINRSKSNKH